jgi:hypothetical protein
MTVMDDKNYKNQNYGEAFMVVKTLHTVRMKFCQGRIKRHAMQEYIHIFLT